MRFIWKKILNSHCRVYNYNPSRPVHNWILPPKSHSHSLQKHFQNKLSFTIHNSQPSNSKIEIQTKPWTAIYVNSSNARHSQTHQSFLQIQIQIQIPIFLFFKSRNLSLSLSLSLSLLPWPPSSPQFPLPVTALPGLLARSTSLWDPCLQAKPPPFSAGSSLRATMGGMYIRQLGFCDFARIFTFSDVWV